MSRSKYKYDLSIVLNVHREARRMQPTVRSLKLCLDDTLQHNYKVEVVVVLDRSDELTVDYVNNNLRTIMADISVTVVAADFGDLGLSRNFGIENCSGEYIGVVDADDLFSTNLTTKSLEFLQKNPTAVVHPEYIVSFGDHSEIWRPTCSRSKTFNPAGIVQYNPWSSVSFASAVVRSQVHYSKTPLSEGFGPEDWHWNCEVIAAGLDHYIVPGTAYFYRRKAVGSLAMAHASSRSLLPKTDLLNYTSFSKYISRRPKYQPEVAIREEPVSKPLRSLTLKVGRVAYFQSRKVVRPVTNVHWRLRDFADRLHPLLVEMLQPPSNKPVKNDKPLVSDTLPAWLLKEWVTAHTLEHKLYPSEDILRELGEYRPQASLYAEVYWRLARTIGDKIDYLFMVPWIKTGGADLGILHYINAIIENDPKSRVVVITNERSESTWRHRLPESVIFIDLDDDFFNLSPEEQTRLLATLFIQIPTSHMHVVNSIVGFRLLTEYSKQLSKYIKLYVSAFAVDYLPGGRRAHYILDHLNYSIDYLSGVLTDNENIVDKLVEWQAMPRDKFKVQYFPCVDDIKPVKDYSHTSFTTGNPLKIVWAGRLDVHKRPEVLIKVAKRTAELSLPVEFHVHGGFVTEGYGGRLIEDFQSQSNVTYHGPFSGGVKSLPLDNYDVFLMTTAYEGLPNVILEATAGGLLIVAPDVGGIGEFVGKNAGYLIPEYDDIEAYISVLRQILKDPNRIAERTLNAQKLLKRRHSWGAFVNTLKTDKYLD